MTPNDTEHTGIYLRKSTKDGAEQSIESQRETVHAWMRSRGEDPTLATEYVDVLSAYDERLHRRPGWQDLEDDLRAGRRTRIVARHTDRLYRHWDDLQSIVELVEQTGITVQTVWSGDLDLSNASGRTTARIMADVNMGEVETMRQRVKAKLAQNRANGKPHGGSRAFGWNRDGSLIKEEADAIRWAMTQVIEGVNLSKIAKTWESAGLRSTRGNVMTTTTIKNILTSERLTGHLLHKGEVIAFEAKEDAERQTPYEPIAEPEMLAAVQAILKDPTRRTNTNGTLKGRSPVAPLTQVIECGKCGRTLVSGYTIAKANRKTDEKRTYPVYKCRNGCGSINRATAENAVSMAMLRLWMHGDISDLAPTKELQDRLTHLAQEQKDLDEEKLSAARMRANNDIGLGEYEILAKGLRKRSDALQRDYDAVSRKFALATALTSPMHGQTVDLGDAAAVMRHWESLDADRQRRQASEAWRIVLRPGSVAAPRTFTVDGTEHKESLTQQRRQQRRLLFVSKLSDALSFDPVEEDVAEAMAAVAESL